MQKDKLENNDLIDKNKSKSIEMFYSIYLGPGLNNCSNTIVFKDKIQALKVLKLVKKGRLKAFLTEKEAIYFAEHGSDNVHGGTCPPPIEGGVLKGPKALEVSQFCRAIERNDIEYVNKCIKENPRYLVSSGDTPSILREFSRYNALHIVAVVGNASICRLVLNSLKNPKFYEKLYLSKGKSVDRSSILLDLYLNTPDKTLNETPLHIASKFGALEVVKVLVLEKECDKTRRNKFGLTPFDVACSKVKSLAIWKKEAIQAALRKTYFVPVLRSTGNTVQPIIGEPFVPSSPPDVFNHATKNSPPLQIHALAGPMTEEEAVSFRKQWKTPTKSLNEISPSRTDPEKGLEKVGRQLASSSNVLWKEYWGFLNAFVDFKSDEGLNCLENYLERKLNQCSLTDIVRSNGSHTIAGESSCSDSQKKVSNVPADNLASLVENLYSCSIDKLNYKISPQSSIFFSENIYKSYAVQVAKKIKEKKLKPLLKEIQKMEIHVRFDLKRKCLDRTDLPVIHYYFATLIVSDILKESKKRVLYFLKHEVLRQSKRAINNLCKCPPLVETYEPLMCIANFIVIIVNGKDVYRSHGGGDCGPNLPIQCNCSFDLSNVFIHMEEAIRTIHFLSPTAGSIRKNGNVPTQSLDSNNDTFELSLNNQTFLDTDETNSDSLTTCSNDDDEEYFDCKTLKRNNFLSGDFYSKLDTAVLDSISNVPISQNQYPFIYFWKSLCSKFQTPS